MTDIPWPWRRVQRGFIAEYDGTRFIRYLSAEDYEKPAYSGYEKITGHGWYVWQVFSVLWSPRREIGTPELTGHGSRLVSGPHRNIGDAIASTKRS